MRNEGCVLFYEPAPADPATVAALGGHPRMMEALQQRNASGRAILEGFKRDVTAGRAEHPQLFRAFKNLGWDDAFMVFLSAFRGNLRGGTLTAALMAAEESGRFDRHWLHDIAEGRLKVVGLVEES